VVICDFHQDKLATFLPEEVLNVQQIPVEYIHRVGIEHVIHVSASHTIKVLFMSTAELHAKRQNLNV